MTRLVASTKLKKKKLKPQHLLISLGAFLVIALTVGTTIYWAHSTNTQTADQQAFLAPNWRIQKTANNHQVEGYASLGSVRPGGIINFQVSCKAVDFTTDIFRMGWYNGRGAEYMTTIGRHKCQKGDVPLADKSTGLINLDWPSSFQVHIPDSWKPGIYLAKLTSSDGYQNYIPFTVRSPKPQSRFLFVHAINTDLAYNFWGGNSLYRGNTPDLKISRAVEASLNRPFLMPVGGNDGSGYFLDWEYPMILFLEEDGYQVDYTTDIDIHEHPDTLLQYKAVIITGHDEYWSRQMLDGYKNALAHGVNLAVFGANTAYRPVRFEPDPYTKQPDRIMVNYKSADLDPFTKTNPNYSTPPGWQSPPLNDPPSELLGDSYGGEVENGAVNTISGNLVVSDQSSWIFDGTGLKKGDKISDLVGYEYDEFINSNPHPPGVDIIFHSPLMGLKGKSGFADSTYYQSPSGGQVFDAGTLEWSWGLDLHRKIYSPELAQVTENILNRFGGGSASGI